MRDAPCPHCGSLLWFSGDGQGAANERARSPSYEQLLIGVGEKQLGPLAAETHSQLIDVLDCLTAKDILPTRTLVLAWTFESRNWDDIMRRLQLLDEGEPKKTWLRSLRTFFARQSKRMHVSR